MKRRISFILNNELIDEEINPAIVALDFIRDRRFTGTKEGCKEGDCGACTVLIGELTDGTISYKAVNSCLVPLFNVRGKHVVTIEGLNLNDKKLNPLQQAFVDEGASQCGFCTPGFIVSLTCFFLNEEKSKSGSVIDALDGNICRCTGHNSIIRAAESMSLKFERGINSNGTRIKFLTENNIIPKYFLNVKSRLENIHKEIYNSSNSNKTSEAKFFISNGTDLFVQRPDEILTADIRFLDGDQDLSGITIKDERCIIGSSTTVTGIAESTILNNIFPDLNKFSELFGSTPIRNSATVGGNLCNASPIGDMTAFFMALNSEITMTDGKDLRKIPLKDFYKGYKIIDRKHGEIMKNISFAIPSGNYFFNFEKVSKRTYLDIASVNTAILISLENGTIVNSGISAGGIAATPLFLSDTCSFLNNKELTSSVINEAVTISMQEISPISDARGSSDYKRLLLSRLMYTHFITLFPEIITISETI